MKRTAIVTGAAGFIGRHVSRTLAEAGRRVVGLGLGDWPPGERETFGVAEWHDSHITAGRLHRHGEDACEVFHCAGSGSVALSFADPRRDFESNVVTTMEVLEFARERGGVRVVLPSSAGIYGLARKMPIHVDTPHHPVSPYGVNKKIGEEMCGQYARYFAVDVAIVRLFSVYGDGLQKQLLWDACNKLMRNDLEFFGTGDETRDWIHVEDAARLLVTAAELASRHVPKMNGATGRAVRIRDVVETLAGHLNVTDPIRFNGNGRAGDPVHYEADVTEALATGWRPSVDFSDGLARYAKWFKSVIETKR